MATQGGKDGKMIINILKDGTVLDDITGHLVKREDVPEFYEKRERREKKDDGCIVAHDESGGLA